MAIGTATALLGGAALGLAGSAMSSGAAKDAANAQAAAHAKSQRESLALQREFFDRQMAMLMPQAIVGNNALAGLADMVGISRPVENLILQQYLEQQGLGQQAPQTQPQQGFNLFGLPLDGDFGGFMDALSRNQRGGLQHLKDRFGGFNDNNPASVGQGGIQMTQGRGSDLASSPGFLFRLGTGLQAVENSAAARGLGRSGRGLASITDFAQGLASNEYQNRFNRLATLAGFGNAASSQGSAAAGNFGANVGGQIAQHGQNLGAIRASGIAGQANALGGGLASLGNTLGMAAGMGAFGGGSTPPPASNIVYYGL